MPDPVYVCVRCGTLVGESEACDCEEVKGTTTLTEMAAAALAGQDPGTTLLMDDPSCQNEKVRIQYDGAVSTKGQYAELDGGGGLDVVEAE